MMLALGKVGAFRIEIKTGYPTIAQLLCRPQTDDMIVSRVGYKEWRGAPEPAHGLLHVGHGRGGLLHPRIPAQRPD